MVPWSSNVAGLYVVGLKVTNNFGVSDTEDAVVHVIGAEDVTALVRENKFNLRFNRISKIETFDMTLTNISASPLAAPLVLVVEDISPLGLGALKNEDGTTSDGKPFFDYSRLINGDNVLSPGETSGAKTWQVHNPSKVRWSFTISVWSGPMP